MEGNALKVHGFAGRFCGWAGQSLGQPGTEKQARILRIIQAKVEASSSSLFS